MPSGEVVRFARGCGGDAELARDVTSETFLRAWAGRDAIRVASARAYLFAIARHLLSDERRRRRRHGELPDDVPGAGARADERIELGQVLEHVRRLPEAYRDALLLVSVGELSYEEAARVLSVPLTTLKIRVHRARLKLADALPHAEEIR